jgi:hypothetical protein
MGDLFERVRNAVREERYLFSDHADNMLRERSIVHWQVVDGLENGRLLIERPAARPNPVIEVEQALADGTQIKAVWAYVRGLDFAKLVTVHFFDE